MHSTCFQNVMSAGREFLMMPKGMSIMYFDLFKYRPIKYWNRLPAWGELPQQILLKSYSNNKNKMLSVIVRTIVFGNYQKIIR